MPADEIKFELLPDGRLKIETDDISPAAHKNADDFLRFIEREMAGESATKKKYTQHKHRIQQGQER